HGEASLVLLIGPRQNRADLLIHGPTHEGSHVTCRTTVVQKGHKAFLLFVRQGAFITFEELVPRARRHQSSFECAYRSASILQRNGILFVRKGLLEGLDVLGYRRKDLLRAHVV